MKKSLIALAALAAVGVASAQSSVTMYGLVDVGFGSHKTTNLNGAVSLKSSGVMDGSNAGSRIGFRGTEDLGGGLSASFTVEQGIAPTAADGFNKRTASAGHQIDGAGTYSTGNNRQAFLGLSSKALGTLRIGYQYTNSYDLVAFNGLSPSEFQGGNFQNGTTVAGSAVSTHANGSRANAVTYMSNSMGGFTIKAQYGQGAGRKTAESNLVASAAAAAATEASAAGDTGTNGFLQNNNTYTSLMLQYAQGPIYAAVAYSKANVRTNPGTSVAVDPFGAVLNAQPAAAAAAADATTASTNRNSRTIDGYNLGASYDFGMAKVSYVGAKIKGPGATLATGGLLVDTEVKANQVAVFVPVGALTLSASTGKAKRTTGVTVNNDVKGTYFGARYALSKRTTAYVLTGSEKDKAVTTSSTTSANYKDSKTVVGVSHSF